jgi:hypothetical protein
VPTNIITVGCKPLMFACWESRPTFWSSPNYGTKPGGDLADVNVVAWLFNRRRQIELLTINTQNEWRLQWQAKAPCMCYVNLEALIIENSEIMVQFLCLSLYNQINAANTMILTPQRITTHDTRKHVVPANLLYGTRNAQVPDLL